MSSSARSAADYSVMERANPLLIGCALLIIGFVGVRTLTKRFFPPQAREFIFPGLKGPSEKSVVRPLSVASWRGYDRAGSSNLAILLTDTASAWLGVARGLSSIGVPFTITTDWQAALAHRVVWVYPRISGKVLSGKALRAIGAVPRSGGTLIASEIVGGGLEEVFGFDSLTPSRTHQELRFQAQPAARFNLIDEFDKVIRIGAIQKIGSQQNFSLGSYDFHITNADPLATYEDGTPGVLHRAIGTGHAYAFGVDIGALLRLGYDNREEGRFARSYANGYEPTLDVLLRIIRSIYAAGEPDAVTVGTVPYGRALSLILTHDIDFARDWPNAITFARFEQSKGIRATYFIQTKYVRDYNDEIFFDSSAVRYVKLLASMGMEIGSHTVAHSRQFASMPIGSGAERYPAYQPFVQDQLSTLGASVLGEIRVSKFLLQQGTEAPIVSFRPGYLSDPFQLPEALEATGFSYSSSTTANNSLSHLPFRLSYDRSSIGESSIFEFPVTVEDEAKPPMNERLGAALDLANRISKYGGIYVLLTHPNVTAEKLDFEERLVAAMSHDAWIGSLDQFGAWWSARDKVQLETRKSKAMRTLEVRSPTPLYGLSLNVPLSWKLVTAPNGQVSQSGQTVTIDKADGVIILTFGTT